MRNTPTEGVADRRERDQSGSGRSSSGVRGVVGSLLTKIRQTGRLLHQRIPGSDGTVPNRSSDDRHTRRSGGDRNRLTASKTDGDQQPRPLPDGPQVCIEHDKDALRVYDPARNGAYISSDTWQRIER